MAARTAAWEKKAGDVKKQPAESKESKALSARAKKGAAVATTILAEEAPYKYPPGFKAPKSLAVGADAYYTTKQSRLNLQKDVDTLEVQEQALKHWLIENLPKKDASGVAGKLARVAVVIKDIPKVSSWPEVYSSIVDDYLRHLKKKDGQQDSAFALVNRAISAGTVKDLWKDGKTVKGVEVFHKADLSVNKV